MSWKGAFGNPARIFASRETIVSPAETLWVKAFNDRFEKNFEYKKQVANEVAPLSIHLSSMTQVGRKYTPKAEAYAYY